MFKYLRSHCSAFYRPTKGKAKEIPWNFTKFIVNSNGEIMSYFPPEQTAEMAIDDIKDFLADPDSRTIG